MEHDHRHHGRRREYYLEDVPIEEAYRRFYERLDAAGLGPLDAEAVPLDEALGRVTAEPIWARRSSPHYNAAAMDGAAVRAADTVRAIETAPIRLRVGPQAVWVDTGDPMPDGFDAVIMREVIHEAGGDIEIMAPAAPWQHVRPMGEDIVATELVLPENHTIRPEDVGAVAAGGVTSLPVRRRPRVAIIPTGSELVPPTAAPAKGDIVEYNSLMLAAQVTEWGGEPLRKPIVADDPALIAEAVATAVRECDAVAVNAGSSAGSEDFTASVVRDLGELLVHGVAVRPGHPVVLGVIGETPVLGIPGYPASAVVTSELFLKPLLDRMLGRESAPPQAVEAVMSRKVLSPMGEDEWLRVKLGRVGGRLIAAPLQRGAGVIMSLVRADGLALIPRFSEGVNTGDSITVHLRRPLAEIDNTVVVIGSHDVTLDLLASHLRRRQPPRSLASSNVGSLGGLVALRRGQAHAAGSHLLDEETGEYNRAYVERHRQGRPMVMVTLAHRVQGLMTLPGNPKGVMSLEDLAGGGVSFVNRQRGSGTRVLLDYKLAQLGIEPGDVRGYEREEYTHLAVAAQVASGAADAGLGVMAAARALDLGFTPLLEERYDLVIPREFYDSDLLAPVLDLLDGGSARGKAFRGEVEALGGYDTREMGRVAAEIG